MMAPEPINFQDNSEVFRFGGFGTVLLISLLTFIGLYPLMLGEIAGRLAGGTILAVIMVASAVTASKSRTLRTAGVVLAFFAIGLQVEWLNTWQQNHRGHRRGRFCNFLSLHSAANLSPRPFIRAGLC